MAITPLLSQIKRPSKDRINPLSLTEGVSNSLYNACATGNKRKGHVALGTAYPRRNALPKKLEENYAIPNGREHKRRRIDTTFTSASETPPVEFSSGGERGSTSLDDLTLLVTTIKDIISQNNAIQVDLTDIKSQNAKLQVEIMSLQTKLDAYSTSTHSTRSWASIAESGTTSSVSRATSMESLTKELNCARIST
ncbi:hypothetical protein K432DRAFT_468862 [Lepidopterella palustris CBS 459.81]|uniref:Uncharacterized protein n=1 Tax=Lepidopterella palustris CBS 459.81 TaxID=1314670 RepID=A0A8E2E012_9PEZI|nr:hypothetical protein K432DRAFT_468862 [Lepidopterella palustris CBS 459.81]